jgi:hypothetical protein
LLLATGEAAVGGLFFSPTYVHAAEHDVAMGRRIDQSLISRAEEIAAIAKKIPEANGTSFGVAPMSENGSARPNRR